MNHTPVAAIKWQQRKQSKTCSPNSISNPLSHDLNNNIDIGAIWLPSLSVLVLCPVYQKLIKPNLFNRSIYILNTHSFLSDTFLQSWYGGNKRLGFRDRKLGITSGVLFEWARWYWWEIQFGRQESIGNKFDGRCNRGWCQTWLFAPLVGMEWRCTVIEECTQNQRNPGSSTFPNDLSPEPWPRNTSFTSLL